MAVEFIRPKIIRPGAAPLQLFGGVILRIDGSADFFGDAQEHAEEISALLEKVRLDTPFVRVTVAALERNDRPALMADMLRLDDVKVVGPLLLSVDEVPAVGGAVDAEIAARAHRALLRFMAARRADVAAPGRHAA